MDEARKQIANEIDPSESRKALKLAKDTETFNSFEAVAREWLAKKMQSKSEGYRKNVLRRFELYLFQAPPYCRDWCPRAFGCG